jgi:hypothetical protein
MGLAVGTAAKYRLLYVQPDPENGDRACVGLLFSDQNDRANVIYDPNFTKVRCIAPELDLELLRLYFDDLKSSIRRSDDVSMVLRGYAPQITTSETRSVVAPVTRETEQRLLERFAGTKRSVGADWVVAPMSAAEAIRAEVNDHIADFVEAVALPLRLRVFRNPTPQQLFGKPMSRIGTVAAGVRVGSTVILVDGVDLTAMTPRRSVSITNRVVHIFWQYGRLRERDLVARQTPFDRVGLVLNGRAEKTPAYKEAHDYAVDQFGKEADITIDGSSEIDKKRLQDLLVAAQG